MPERVETVIVGGGQAGLAMSYRLRQLGREHVVLERGRVGERWHSERWDSLTLLTPNWLTRLPGLTYEGDEPEGFLTRLEVIDFLERYAARFALPVRLGAAVVALREVDGVYRLDLADGGAMLAANVVLATGAYARSRVPALATALPPEVLALPTTAYRNPAQLPPGGVVVVGSGAGGCQIADELAEAGRPVYLSVGRCGRRRRRYRGGDTLTWSHAMGLLDRPVEAMTAAEREAQRGQYTGVRGGYDLDYARLVAAGGTLLGRLVGIEAGVAHFADDLSTSLAAWEASRALMEGEIDAYIAARGLAAPPAEPVTPPSALPTAHSPRRLDLGQAGIGGVIWAIGYEDADGWIEAPIFDGAGRLSHRHGLTDRPGLYVLGRPWLSAFKSSFLYGVGDDAARLATAIAARASGRAPGSAVDLAGS